MKINKDKGNNQCNYCKVYLRMTEHEGWCKYKTSPMVRRLQIVYYCLDYIQSKKFPPHKQRLISEAMDYINEVREALEAKNL